MAETSGTADSSTHTTRRTVVAAAGTAGLAAALAACGGSGSTASSSSSQSSGSSTSAGSGSGGMQSPTTGSAGGSGALAKTADIPNGGGKIFADKQVVVTQPSAGTFKAFSAVCTHAGCTVSQVQDGTIDCPCHGSKYHIADGSVAQGPATQPLAPAKISVEGSSITLA